MAFFGGGCTNAWIQERRLARTGLDARDTIAIVVSGGVADEEVAELERSISGCVQNTLSDIRPDARMVLPHEFRKVAFPDLTIKQIPAGYYSWQRLVREPGFYAAIAPLGLRYLLAADAEDSSRLTEVEWNAATSMIGGPGPSISWGWEQSVLLNAVVVDARNRRIAGGVQAYASGKSGGGITLMTSRVPFLLPHGIPAFPFSAACRGLGETLATFLADEKPEVAAPATVDTPH